MNDFGKEHFDTWWKCMVISAVSFIFALSAGYGNDDDVSGG